MTTDQHKIEYQRLSEDFIAAIILSICELPDRTSPEDDPEALIVNEDEIRGIIHSHEECFGEEGLSILAATAPDATSVEQGEGQKPYRISKGLMEEIFSTLVFYSHESSYEAERIGGVLQGCPRGEIPTPKRMTENALFAIREIRKEIDEQGRQIGNPAQDALDARKRLEKLYEQGSKTIAAQSEKEMHEKFREAFEAHYKELGEIIAAMRATEAGGVKG